MSNVATNQFHSVKKFGKIGRLIKKPKFDKFEGKGLYETKQHRKERIEQYYNDRNLLEMILNWIIDRNDKMWEFTRNV